MKSWRIVVLILVVISVIIASIYVTNKPFRTFVEKNILKKEVTNNDSKSIYINGVNGDNVALAGNKVYVLQNGDLKIYSSDAKQISSAKVGIGTPIFESSLNYLVMADKNGHNLYFFDDGRKIYDKHIQSEILQVSVNKRGYVAVVTKDSIYKGVVTLYDNYGKEIFKTYISGGYIIKAALSFDSNYLAIGVVDISKSVLTSTIKVIDIKKALVNPQESIKSETTEQNLLTDITFKDDNNIICKYVDAIKLLDRNKQEAKQIIDVNKDYVFMDINATNGEVGIIKTDSNLFKSNYDLNIFSKDGNVTAKYKINDNVPKQLIVSGDNIVLNNGIDVSIVSEHGWLKKKYINDSKSEIQNGNIKISNNLMAIVYFDRIELVNI